MFYDGVGMMFRYDSTTVHFFFLGFLVVAYIPVFSLARPQRFPVYMLIVCVFFGRFECLESVGYCS